MQVESKLKSIWVGKLINFSWKLGITCESSQCASISAPFVSLSLQILNTEGKTNNYNFDLTIPEFQVKISTLLFSKSQ